MCGIAGYSTIGSEAPIDPQYIEPMIHSLDHRGPDEWGTAVYPQLAMANARLSIIDLSGGKQPISNADGSTEIVYNGELYNAPELTAELKAKGYIFKTRTDTEVLVHLYDEEGIDFLKRLDGMFALCLYDKKQDRIVLARDRFGVKPLYYSHNNAQFAFASEIKALKILPNFDDQMSPEGAAVFLGLYFMADPWTIYKHVHMLRPGHYLVLSKEGLTDGEYFDYDFSRKESISLLDAEAKTAELLRASVKRQLLSDVPVGILLSGGLDSRSVLAAATANESGPTSFTISFAEEVYNEGGEAAFWARQYGSPHKPMIFSDEDFTDLFLERQKHLDDPHGAWCNVAMGAFSTFIRDSGFKVVLSGEGGDELFLGYPTIHAANIARYYRKMPGFVRDSIKALSLRLPAGNNRLPLSFKIKSFAGADHPDPLRMFFGFKEVVKYDQWKNILTPEAFDLIGHIDPYLAFSQYADKTENMHFIDAMSYLDCKVFLPGSCLIRNDNAFMASSVESRVPMLDNDLVNFATSLPLDVKFHPLKPKRVLLNALKKHFKPDTDEIPPKYRKNGFEVPHNLWIKRDPFKSLFDRIMSPERLEQTGFFRPEAVRKLIDEQLAGTQNNERPIQTIMALHLFLDGSYSF